MPTRRPQETGILDVPGVKITICMALPSIEQCGTGPMLFCVGRKRELRAFSMAPSGQHDPAGARSELTVGRFGKSASKHGRNAGGECSRFGERWRGWSRVGHRSRSDDDANMRVVSGHCTRIPTPLISIRRCSRSSAKLRLLWQQAVSLQQILSSGGGTTAGS